jgi:hypothetical protein
MKEYFQLQFRRQMRILRDLGVNPFFGVLVGIGVFIWVSFILFKKVFYPQYFYSFICIVMVSTAGEKTRNEFLQIIFTKIKYRFTRLLENVIFAIPFSIFLVFKDQPIMALATIVLSAAFSFFNGGTKSSFVIPSPFSKTPFEFTIGFRRTFWLLAIILTITVISIIYQNFNLGIFCLMGIFLVCLSYYSGQEPVFYVWIFSQTPKEFLKGKIKTALRYSFTMSLFIAIPLAVFNPSNTWIILLIILIGQLYMILIVVGIYSNYPARLNLIQNIQLAIGILCPPFLLYAIPNLYSQSIRRLNAVLK